MENVKRVKNEVKIVTGINRVKKEEVRTFERTWNTDLRRKKSQSLP